MLGRALARVGASAFRGMPAALPLAMTMNEWTVEGAEQVDLGVAFLVATRQGALARLHELARVRAGLHAEAAATDAALAAMQRSLALVLELVDGELDDASWTAEPARRAL
jgi:hypothetical protein